MGRFGATELLLLLGLAVLFFGGRKLGDVGRGLGEAVRNLKQGLKDEPEQDPDPPVLAGGDVRPAKAKTAKGSST